eukprot:TRINITY_DN7869_c0_g1_i1.p1 TRINITY_DN7869_c0_g1~~TRINITY_DN7869_c0_g1_i1.p1  ORF type:complete len:351 (+),score=72.46 TRINITY_DN7869_c0_g1_i1:119-1171(+)
MCIRDRYQRRVRGRGHAIIMAHRDFSWMQDGGVEGVPLSAEMQQSYQAAAQRASPSSALHVIDRFPITQDQWDYMVDSTVAPCFLQKGMSVFDAGCGAGAYLDSILRMNPELDLSVHGIDFAPGLIDIAKQRLPEGSDLSVGDAREYKHVPSDSYDVALSFGVFFYFDGEQDVRQGLKELARVCKPGGRVMVGRMNTKEVIEEIPSHVMKRNYAAYFPRQTRVDSRTFWQKEAAAAGLEFESVKSMDELYDLHRCSDLAMGRLRHCAYFRKPKEEAKASNQTRLDKGGVGCGTCGAEAAGLRCSRCKVTWYCSKQCQRSDWKHHKLSCRETEEAHVEGTADGSGRDTGGK